jgi:mitochondrial fission protein ELM1
VSARPSRDVDAAALPSERVWVLDDPRAGTAAQALGIAERLGVPFRRIPLAWNWMAHVAGLARNGSLLGLAGSARQSVARGGGERLLPPFAADPPDMEGAGPSVVLSAGSRSAAVALWLKERTGCRVVHCMRPGLGGFLRADRFDLLVIPEHDHPGRAANVLPILGAPHRVSPLNLRQAAAAWRERLGHLPHPRVALLVGGPMRGTDLAPALAHRLGSAVARLTAERGGAVLATTSRRTGAEASDALAAGLARTMHLLYRWGEPGENPYLGVLASADAIVVTADSVSMISEACATTVPVFVALPELAGPRHRRLIASLHRAGQVRVLGDELSPWPRQPLDESGRVAAEIIRRFQLD